MHKDEGSHYSRKTWNILLFQNIQTVFFKTVQFNTVSLTCELVDILLDGF